MEPRLLLSSGLLCLTVLASTATAAEPPVAALVQRIKAVSAEGQGNADANRALQELAKGGGKSLTAILGAMNGANDYALNWLRAAVETIAQHESAARHPLPLAELKQFLANTREHPQARRLAYDLIAREDPATAKALLPGFLNDPSNELRRDAVQLLVDAAAAQTKAGDRTAAAAGLGDALKHARDPDQIESIAKSLTDLGQKVDLQKTFGWLTRWKIIGPFDNTGGAGFEKAFPPEQSVDATAEYDGKAGKVRWQDYQTKSEYGLIDFNQPLDALKEVTAYASTEFWTEKGRTAEIRLGCKNGWKVWLNGKLLFGRDEYHRGVEIDQYRLTADLKPGKNVLLIKCCQNEQKEDWTKEWEFQVRITDAEGTPLASSKSN